jgi:hypothetical protein
MVSHKLMLEFLKIWGENSEPLMLREIGRRTERNDSNARRVVAAMLECGILESCPVPDPSGKKQCLVGYRPVVRAPTKPPVLDQSYIDQSYKDWSIFKRNIYKPGRWDK